MSSLKNIRQALKTSLESVLADKAVVYSYYESAPQQYPCVIFDISSQQGDFLTDAENLHSITFQAILQVKISDDFGDQVATEKVDDLTDIITTQLESDWSLGATVDYCSPVIGQREYISIPDGTARTQYINIVVKVSQNVV